MVILDFLKRNPKLESIMVDFNQQIRFQYIKRNLKPHIASLNPNLKHYKIVDVGAGMGILTSYLEREFNCKAINIETSKSHKLKNLVVGDGRNLPLKDTSADFVVSSDVLEHIPNKDRTVFLEELLRCSRFGVIITYSNLQTNNPQKSAIKIFEALCRQAFPIWYLEHNSNGLVNIETLATKIRNQETTLSDFSPIGGLLAVFFTGFLLNTPYKGQLHSLLNMLAFIVVKLIDGAPYYNFGATIIKNPTGLVS